MQDAALVRSTYADARDAWAAARRVVEAGLGACAHVTPVRSCYLWEGRLEECSEALLEVRCLPAQANALASALDAAHPYELPLVEVLASQVQPSYAAWMRGEGIPPRGDLA